jgi:hypothetical protein
MSLLESKLPRQPRGAAVMIGRFQPPHIGHYALLARLIAVARSERWRDRVDPRPFVVVIDGKKSSQDRGRNPLTADERLRILRASGRADGARLETAPDAHAAFELVRRAGYEPLLVATGDDRDYKGLLDSAFTDDGKPIEREYVSLERGGGDPDQILAAGGDLPAAMASGTLARRAVERGDRDAFERVVGLKRREASDRVFDRMAQRMGVDKEKNDGTA